MDLTLAHDLMLVSLDPETGKRRSRQNVGYGLVGALLAELAIAGRIDLDGSKVSVLNPAPLGSPRTDDLLSRITQSKPRKARVWAEKLNRTYSQDVLDDLCTAELVRREGGKVLGVFDATRYPQVGGARRSDLLEQMRSIMVRGLTPTHERIVALAAIIVAVGLHKNVFPGTPKRQLVTRLKELDSAGWASEAVRRAIQAAQAAAVAASSASVSGGH